MHASGDRVGMGVEHHMSGMQSAYTAIQCIIVHMALGDSQVGWRVRDAVQLCSTCMLYHGS